MTLDESVLYDIEDVGTRGLSLAELEDMFAEQPAGHIFDAITRLINANKIHGNPGGKFTAKKNRFELPMQK